MIQLKFRINKDINKKCQGNIEKIRKKKCNISNDNGKINDIEINPHIETPEKVTEEEIKEIIKINNQLNYNLEDKMENIEINKENEAAKTTTLEEANFFNNKYNLSVNHKDNNVNNFINFTKTSVANNDIDINREKEGKRNWNSLVYLSQMRNVKE